MENHPKSDVENFGNDLSGESEDIISGDTSTQLLNELFNDSREDDSKSSKKQLRTQHLSSLALLLFDRTQPLHGLSDDNRDVLEKAIQMRDLPITTSKKKKPYQAALEFIQSQLAQELPDETDSTEELGTLAAVLVIYQGNKKGKEIAQLNLSPVQQRQVLTIVALMRIVVGLDHSKSGETLIQKVETARDGMWIVVDGPQTATDAATAQR